jgi:type I restriction enzyme S subunit
MVPEGWNERTLESLSVQKVTYGVVKPGEVRTGGVPFVRGGDFPNGTIRISALRTISQEISNAYKRTLLKGGEILVSLVGYPGATAIVPTELAGANIARQAALVRPSDNIDRDYLFQFLRSDIGQKRMLSQSIGSAQQVINLKDLNALSVTCPPLPEQRKIAEILSTWDAAIEKTEALLATAKAQKRALMQSLLTGKRRFPEFEGQEWKEVRLTEIAEAVTARNDGEELPVLTISSRNGFVRQDEKYARNMAGRSVERYYRLKRGEFAYNKGNSRTYQFGCVLRLDEYDEGLVPHVYVCFRLKPGHDSNYFRGLFLADYLRPQLSRMVNTGVRNNGLLNISPKSFWTVKVPLPSLEEQTRIGQVLDDCLSEEQLLATNIEKLRTEKKALMQQLLTGKRRVVV